MYSAYQTRYNDCKSKLQGNLPQSYYDMEGFSAHDYGLQAECPTHGHGSTAGTTSGQGDLLMHSNDLVDSHQEQRHQHSVLHSQYGTNGRPSSQHSHLYEKNQPRHGT